MSGNGQRPDAAEVGIAPTELQASSMSKILVQGIATAYVDAIRSGGADANGQTAVVQVSRGLGNPCRHCLGLIEDGNDKLVLSYRPFTSLQPYAETARSSCTGASAPGTKRVRSLLGSRTWMRHWCEATTRLTGSGTKLVACFEVPSCLMRAVPFLNRRKLPTFTFARSSTASSAALIEGRAREGELRRLTFELTPRAEAGGVSPVRDDATPAADWAYDACRSESGVERVVRPHHARADLAYTCKAWHSVEGGRFVESVAEHELDAARALRNREGGERGLAVLHKSAAPDSRPAERQGAVPRLQRARVRSRRGRSAG